MSIFYINKGKDIRLKGKAQKEIVALPVPKKVAIQPSDFCGFKPRLIVKQGDSVKVGSPLMCDKDNPDLVVTSPASGLVAAINRGEKRVLLEIVVETDGRQDPIEFVSYSSHDIKNIDRQEIVKALLSCGLWPTIRQRPFSKIAKPQGNPKAIFIHAMNTEPLAPDVDFVMEGMEKQFQAGIDVLGKLTKGKIHLCVATAAKSKSLTEIKNAEIHKFSGPHPTGCVSTHIQKIDPLNKGEVVWYVQAQDVCRIGQLFLTGKYPVERIVAVTGEGAKNNVYVKTIVGAPLSTMLQGSILDGMRCISGSILSGKSVGPVGYLCFYDSQITVVPEGGKRELLGWLAPGFNKYSLSRTFVSSFLSPRDVSLDTDKHGSDRAIVFNHVYDQYVSLDIMTYFLLKAVLAGDVEEAERLGILECHEEDFALCTFACPSKVDVGSIIRQGLDLIEKDG